MKTPCELIVWYILPVVRSELTRVLVQEHGLAQKTVAKKLGVTEAAVSQYISKKRGKPSDLDENMLCEIRQSAGVIKSGDQDTTMTEICRICNVFKSGDGLEKLYKKHSKDGFIPKNDGCSMLG